ncbi:MAG: TraR/DksA C4-type zinc finger protein [Elusimicrobia bacterium]|nr:TraR/DksA C4-type zinc finger protein [Elusimicrobiota bacterium]
MVKLKAKPKAKAKPKTAIKPLEKKVSSPLSAPELKSFKKELLDHQQKLIKELEEKRNQELAGIIDLDPGDDADVATHTYEKEMLFGISGSERETLMQIEDAIRKIQAKTYGVCDRCKKTIPLKRLRVLPYSRYCLVCQNLFESRSL